MGPYARFCTPCSLANAGRRVPDEGYRPKLKRNPGNRTKGKVKRDAGALGGKQSSRRNFNAWKKAFVVKKKWLDRILAPRRSIRQCKNHKKCGRRARSVRAIFCTPCFLANAKKMGREGGLATKGKLKRKLKKVASRDIVKVKNVKVTRKDASRDIRKVKRVMGKLKKGANCHKSVPQKNAQQIIRVNAMRQNPRTIDGPNARQRSACCENSSPLKLAQLVESKQSALTEQVAGLAHRATRLRPHTRSVIQNNLYFMHGVAINLYTDADMMALALTSSEHAQAFRVHYENAKTLSFLRRMVWHKTVGEVLGTCSLFAQETHFKYKVAGQALQIVDMLSREKVCSVVAPLICPVNAVSVAFALTRLGLKMVVTPTEQHVFQKAARRVLSPEQWAMAERIELSLTKWQV